MLNSMNNVGGYSQKDKQIQDERERVHRFIATRALRTDKRELTVDSYGFVNLNVVEFTVEKELTTGDIDHRKLGFHFGAVRNISFKRLGLDSLYAFPYLANMVDASENNISSINELPMCKYKTLNLSKNPITSLHGIAGKLTECTLLAIPDTVRSHILGLLKVKGLKTVVTTEFLTKDKVELFLMLKIVNKHLSSKNPNMIDCQRELIENDLDEYAEM
jgi:hypothetical protein